MDYLLLGRIAKLVALLGFLLPWVTVSCSGTELLTATGLQLMTGDIQPSGALAGADAQAADRPGPNPFVIAALVSLAAGLVASLLTRARMAAGVLLAGAIAGMGLSYYAIENLRQEMTRSIDDAREERSGEADGAAIFGAEQQNEMARAMAGAIRIEEQEGYWLTMGAAGMAGILALIVLAGAGAARRPDETVGGTPS